MRCSEIILNLLSRGANGAVENYYDFFLELTAKLGEEEEFANEWIKENESLFDLINSEEMYYFYVEEDTRNRDKCKEFLKPYYEQAKKLVR
ncbi:hypothetical protein IU402_02025 [Aerococcaceae bacterium zg-BR9]|uniref:hypothetical protein n=1 Tax=Aerococcaceae bacterium zg-1292 TaxID=2774330 RepID=UPI0040628DBD|nr:hypothetical protein [Aerococcaceae bacterium zg-BR9]